MSAAMAVYACCVVVLFFKMLAISCYQGYFRLRYLAFANPEDAAVFKRPALSVERPEVIRGQQAWRNDLESIPLFIALGGLALALEVAAGVTTWLSLVFTAARVLHTLAYLTGRQPWRTLSYAVGTLCLIGLAGSIAQRVASAL